MNHKVGVNLENLMCNLSTLVTKSYGED